MNSLKWRWITNLLLVAGKNHRLKSENERVRERERGKNFSDKIQTICFCFEWMDWQASIFHEPKSMHSVRFIEWRYIHRWTHDAGRLWMEIKWLVFCLCAFFYPILTTIVFVIVDLIVFVGSTKALDWAEKSNHSIAKKSVRCRWIFSIFFSLSLASATWCNCGIVKIQHFRSNRDICSIAFFFFCIRSIGESTFVYVLALGFCFACCFISNVRQLFRLFIGCRTQMDFKLSRWIIEMDIMGLGPYVFACTVFQFYINFFPLSVYWRH